MALKWLRDQFKHLKIILWGVVAVFVLLVFVDWGSGRPGGGGGADAAVRIGDRVVSEQEFLNELRRNEDRFRQAYGEQWDQLRQQLDLAGQTVRQIVDRQLLLSEAERVGLTVSDRELQDEILSYPAFQRRDGGFVGPEVYQRILRASRMTSHEFERQLSQDLLVGKLTAMIREGVYLSDAEVEEEYRREREVADFDAIHLRYEDFLTEVTLADGEVEAYYEANQESFYRPEQRIIRYLVVETSRLRRLLPVDEGDLAAYFETHRDEFVEGEQARARHILIRVSPAASEQERLESKLRADGVAGIARSGADFEQLAAQHSDDPGSKDNGGDLGWFGRGRMVKEFEEAVFGAKPGDILGPVESQFGYHVIKVEGYQPQRQRPLDEVREQVRFRFLEGRAATEGEVRAAALLRRLSNEKPETDEAWQLLADEDEAVALNVSPPFSAGVVVPGAGDDSTLTADVFAAEEGDIGGVRAIPRGWMVWQLKETKPEGVAPFAEVREQAEQKVRREKALELANGRAAELAARWRSGEDPNALAGEIDTTIVEARDHRRGQTVGRMGVVPTLDDAVFAGAENEVVGPITVTGRGATVVRVDRLQLVDPALLAADLDDSRRQLREQRAVQLLSSIINERRRATVVTVNNELMERFAPRG